MEVRALCIRLMMKVLFLLAAQDEVCCSTKAYPAFPQIIPSRQQFFEYESIIINCEGLMGLTGWRVLKKIKEVIQPCGGTWALSISPCKIKNAIPSIDNGEYWCEIGAKRKSSSVNITVTAGSVILESPVLPVDQGGDVTLGCRNKQSPSNITAQFFKAGISMGTSRTGTMIIYGVSSFDEGLYKCRTSGAGESPQSWLTVREAEEGVPTTPGLQMSLLVQICVSLGVFLLVLLVVVVGLLQWRKRQTAITGTIAASSSFLWSSPPVQIGSRVSQSSKRRAPSAGTNFFLQEENSCYYNIE